MEKLIEQLLIDWKKDSRIKQKQHICELKVFGKGEEVGSIMVWSTQRIGAFVSVEGVAFGRQYGKIGEGGPVYLTHEELKAFDKLCDAWKAERDNWSAFYYSSAGYPGGCGACYYQPPGKTSRIKIGESGRGRHSGEKLQGHEETRQIIKLITISQNVVKTTELWRMGEKYGDREGELVGFVYRLHNHCVVKARRDHLEIKSDNAWTTLEPDEENFIHELILIASNRFP